MHVQSITVHLKRQDELGVGPSQQDDHTFRSVCLLMSISMGTNIHARDLLELAVVLAIIQP